MPRIDRLGEFGLMLRDTAYWSAAQPGEAIRQLGNALACEVALRKRVSNTALWGLGRYAVSVCPGALWIERQSLHRNRSATSEVTAFPSPTWERAPMGFRPLRVMKFARAAFRPFGPFRPFACALFSE